MRIFKEIVVAILIIIIIAIAIGIVLYDKNPTVKVIPEAKEYRSSSEVQRVMDDVRTETPEEKTTIKTYRMDRKEINAYSGMSRFERGKNNPFADYEKGERSSGGSSTTGTTGTNSGGRSDKMFNTPR